MILKNNIKIVEDEIVAIVTTCINKATERLTFKLIKEKTGLAERDIRILSLNTLDELKQLIRLHNLKLRINK